MSTLQQAQGRYKTGGRSLAERYGGEQLGRLGVPADLVTLAGLGLTLAACAVWAAQVYWPPAFWFGWLVAIAGTWLDVIDGAVAKHSKKGRTPFGAILDSITDRVVEGGMFTVLAWVLYRQHAGSWAMAGCVAAAAGSFLVSYTRSKAETQGLNGEVGLGERPVRLVVLGLSVLATRITVHVGFHHYGYQYAAYAVALVAWPTVVQRTWSIRSQLERQAV